MVDATTYKPYGDKKVALSLRDIGNQLLRKLRQEMATNRLPQLKRTFTLPPCTRAPRGAVIEVLSTFGVHAIHVYVPFGSDQAVAKTLKRLIEASMVVFYRDTYTDEVEMEDNEAHHVIVTREEVEDFARKTVTPGQVLRRAQLIPDGDWSEKAEKAFTGRVVEAIGPAILGAARSYSFTPGPDADPVSFFQSYYFALAEIIDPFTESIYYPRRAQQAVYANNVDDGFLQGTHRILGANFWIDSETGEFATVTLRQPIDYTDDGKAQVLIWLTRFNPDGTIASEELYNSTEKHYPPAYKHYSIAYDGEKVYTSYKTGENYMPFQVPGKPVVSNPHDGGYHISEYEYDYNPKTGQVVSKHFTYEQAKSNRYISMADHIQCWIDCYDYYYILYGYAEDYSSASSGISKSLTLSSEITFTGTSRLVGDWGRAWIVDVNNVAFHYPWPEVTEHLSEQDWQVLEMNIFASHGSPSVYRYEYNNWVEHFYPRVLCYFDWSRSKWIYYDVVVVVNVAGYESITIQSIEHTHSPIHRRTILIYNQDGQLVLSKASTATLSGWIPPADQPPSSVRLLVSSENGWVPGLIYNDDSTDETSGVSWDFQTHNYPVSDTYNLSANPEYIEAMNDLILIDSLAGTKPAGNRSDLLTYRQSYMLQRGMTAPDFSAAVGGPDGARAVTIPPKEYRWGTNDKMLNVKRK